MIGLDTAKSVFQIHAINESGKAELKRKLHRSELRPFFEKHPPCTVVLEACGAAHHWARMLSSLGHSPKLIAPEAVKPFVKKGRKNDAVDAAALCTAGSQPDVEFVPMKSGEQQGILALHSARSLLVKQRTMLGNAMRGLASEFGLTVPKSIDKLGELMGLVDGDEGVVSHLDLGCLRTCQGGGDLVTARVDDGDGVSGRPGSHSLAGCKRNRDDGPVNGSGELRVGQ